ncbi:capsule assembly Wzi family protein [Vibrio sp. WXL103]|uniref:capsule assembly Wzi family protein n=1 Tax=Vibrio sp. WXL103 TaxID=3450710 RepID=UPI003EC69932
MKPRLKTLWQGAGLVLLASAALAQAKPWVEPNDLHLRADLQLLANAGIITVPLTTYPLMWDGIISDVRANSGKANTSLETSALQRVNRAYRASQGTQVKLEAGIASDPARFQHFGTPMREKAEVTAGVSDQGRWWAYNLEATLAYDAQDGEDARLDGSYIAGIFGNWVISAGYQQQWYGPGWDTTLLMSTNARPLPSINVTRHRPEAFDVPILEWLGPWTLTTGVGWMNDDRYISDALLWTFRGTIQPHPNFTIGVSRSAQICGTTNEGFKKACDLEEWWKMLIGDTNDYVGGNPGEDDPTANNPANQLASIDFRWGHTLRDVPYSIYYEIMGEDSFKWRIPPFNAHSHLYGADISYYIADQRITTFFEYSETMPSCFYKYNCAYEHGTYKSGYRYHSRVIGSTYDNDANTYTLGFVGINNRNNHLWKANFRYLRLNKQNNDFILNPEWGGNQVSDGEDTWMLDFSYRFPLQQGELELGGQYSYIKYRDGTANEDDISGYVQYRYGF